MFEIFGMLELVLVVYNVGFEVVSSYGGIFFYVEIQGYVVCV